jgi:hypothetical protein
MSVRRPAVLKDRPGDLNDQSSDRILLTSLRHVNRPDGQISLQRIQIDAPANFAAAMLHPLD